MIHSGRTDVQADHAAALPHDLRRGKSEEAWAAAHLQHPLTGFEPGGFQGLVRVSEQPIQRLVDDGNRPKAYAISPHMTLILSRRRVRDPSDTELGRRGTPTSLSEAGVG